jgi:hypothetical protein
MTNGLIGDIILFLQEVAYESRGGMADTAKELLIRIGEEEEESDD